MKRMGLFFVICFTMISCVVTPPTQTPQQTGSKGIVEQVQFVVKDFTVVGMIFLTSEATLNNAGKFLKGSHVTYEMLLKEAQKMGADDIVNLRVDEIRLPASMMNQSVTYKATALAIKYVAAK